MAGSTNSNPNFIDSILGSMGISGHGPALDNNQDGGDGDEEAKEEEEATATTKADAASSDKMSSSKTSQGGPRSLFAGMPKRERNSHLALLVRKQVARKRFLDRLHRKNRPPAIDEEGGMTPAGGSEISLGGDRNASDGTLSSTAQSDIILTAEDKAELQKQAKGLAEIEYFSKTYESLFREDFPVSIKLSDVSFSVQFTEASGKIKTVYNSSLVYQVVTFFKNHLIRKENSQKQKVDHVVYTKHVLENVSLSLKPGKNYLLLGPPASGKSSLLRAIAGRLTVKEKKGDTYAGSITYNGEAMEDKSIHIENAIAFIDQLDRHAPRYTVKETFQFAFNNLRHNGEHVDFRYLPPDKDTPANRALAQKADQTHVIVDLTMKALQIDHVADTFVGNEEVRGVSGGQRRRVTVGEMLMNASPVLCGDEISNGLDARSTFDIVTILTNAGRMRKRVSVLSLLQPSPETVALFDEVIVLAEGKILFAGPIGSVEDHFASLGYKAPEQMDIADFLQVISSQDGAKLYHPSLEQSNRRGSTQAYTIDELAQKFQGSAIGQNILSELSEGAAGTKDGAQESLLESRRYEAKYANNFVRSMWLNLKRELTLWRRNKRVLIANTIKNLIMGVSVGGVFFQTPDAVSITGVLFQGMLFVMLSGMTVAPGFVDERVVFYKQADANFYSAFPFVIAKAMAKLPQVRVSLHQ